MAAYRTYPKAVTPKGTAIFPRLNTPDTKYKPEGVYEVKLAFDADTDLSKLRAQVQQQIDAEHDRVVAKLTEDGKAGLAKKVVKRPLDDHFKAEEDPETGEETGRVIIKAKMTASGVSKKTGKPWKRKPDIIDAKGNKLKNPPQIGGGSVMKLAVELAPYYAPNDKTVGVSFRLEAAQIIKLVSFGERDAAAYGFGEEEGDDLSEADNDFGADIGDDASGDEDDDL